MQLAKMQTVFFVATVLAALSFAAGRPCVADTQCGGAITGRCISDVCRERACVQEIAQGPCIGKSAVGYCHGTCDEYGGCACSPCTKQCDNIYGFCQASLDNNRSCHSEYQWCRHRCGDPVAATFDYAAFGDM